MGSGGVIPTNEDFSTSTLLTILGQIIFCCEWLCCALQDIQQNLWLYQQQHLSLNSAVTTKNVYGHCQVSYRCPNRHLLRTIVIDNSLFLILGKQTDFAPNFSPHLIPLSQPKALFITFCLISPSLVVFSRAVISYLSP